jgi:hypothetical protein
VDPGSVSVDGKRLGAAARKGERGRTRPAVNSASRPAAESRRLLSADFKIALDVVVIPGADD